MGAKTTESPAQIQCSIFSFISTDSCEAMAVKVSFRNKPNPVKSTACKLSKRSLKFQNKRLHSPPVGNKNTANITVIRDLSPLLNETFKYFLIIVSTLLGSNLTINQILVFYVFEF